MSRSTRKGPWTSRRFAPVFAALGDETRLAIVERLSQGELHSIAQLTANTALTRQAVTKHLRVLEDAHIVHSTRDGRESLFTLDPEPIRQLRAYVESVSAHWDSALARLRLLVEE